MTTREAIYKTALEHIVEGDDAVCTDCGWVGTVEQTMDKGNACPLYKCPECSVGYLEFGPEKMAAYALAQGEKVQP